MTKESTNQKPPLFQPRKLGSEKEILSIKSLREKKYNTLQFNEFYTQLFGNPEAKFVMMCKGDDGTGKSVFTLQLADYFARTFGKVLYNSHEEKTKKTIQDRVNNFNISAPKLYIGNALPYDRMMDKIKKNHYHMVIIDSVQYMQFTYEQLKEMIRTFPRRSLGIVMVSFDFTDTNIKNLRHASDIKCHFKANAAGKLTVNVKSRYNAHPVECVLFNPKKSSITIENQQPQMEVGKGIAAILPDAVEVHSRTPLERAADQTPGPEPIELSEDAKNAMRGAMEKEAAQ